MKTSRIQKKNRFYPVVMFAVLLCTAGSITADDTGRGGSAGAFSRMGVGARALGMGGGSVAFTDGAVTAYYNPAGLAFLQHRWITGSLHAMSLDRHITYLGYAQPLGGKGRGNFRGGFSAGWLSAGVGDIDGRDFSGAHTGMMSTAEHAYYFSFAFNPVAPVAIGFNTKLLNYRLPDVYGEGSVISAVGFGFDLGISIRPVKNGIIAFTLRDLRSGYTWDTESAYDMRTQTRNDFPLVFRSGVSWRFLNGSLLAVCDLEKINYRPWRVMGGVEAGSFMGAFVRAGFHYDNLTLGAGYRKKLGDFTVNLDYALVLDSAAPGSNHLMTWSVFF